jgi:cation diffusion facilitator family transporter
MQEIGRGSPKDEIIKARTTAAGAGGIVVLLALLKGTAGLLSGSAALLADALHSVADLLALGASWFGLHLATKKPTDRFPYGFYRVETFAALIASGIILFLGVRLFQTGAARLHQVSKLAHPPLAVAVAAISGIVAWWSSVWQKRAARAAGSQSLAATGDEARLDVGTSLLVLAALLASLNRIPYLEGVIAMAISGLVIWMGAKNAWLAFLSLTDASVDPALERGIAEILKEMPEVQKVEKLRARRSGPFYFVEGHIHVAGSMDVARSHALSHEAQRVIRKRFPEVEAVILHIEPSTKLVQQIIVPIKSPAGLWAEVETHFGRAPWFLIASLENRRILQSAVLENPFQQRTVRAGLAVINRFVKERGIDVALVREIGEISFHGLRDNLVEIYRVPQGLASEALEAYAAGRLKHLFSPTHSSEDKLRETEQESGLVKG